MIYHPKEERLWDCWIYPYKGTYYMYYLSLSPQQYGKGSWDGISLAVSEDLVHWREHGRVLAKRPEAVWIGTGMIQRVGANFIMNFSEECPAGSQRIHFAVSQDLLHWERTEHQCVPDGIHYMRDPSDSSNSIQRWDSLGIIDAAEDHAPPYYAFCTAFSKKTGVINKNGTLALLTSSDGLNWTCLPCAFPDPDPFPLFEVPEHVEFHGRHYVTFCTSSYLGRRFDRFSQDMSGGTFYVVSDNALGPYRLPDGDYMLQGTREHVSVSTVSVGRPLKVGDQVFYYHIWGDNGPNGWAATVKLLEEAAPYRLRLRYNPVNDCLMGTLLARMQDVLPGLALVKQDGQVPPMRFNLRESIRFQSLGTSAALSAKPIDGNAHTENSDLTDGRYVTFQLTIESGEGCGFYFEGVQGAKLCMLLNRKRQRLEFGTVHLGWGPNMVIQTQIRQHHPIQTVSHVKLLARKCFLEVYIDNIYVSSWRPAEEIDPNRFGFYFEDCTGELSNLNIWQMA